MKLFAVEFRRILEALRLQVLEKKLWPQFLEFCVQKQSCLQWNSDAFQKSLPARFTEKVVGAISRCVCPKMKLFAVKFRRILEVFAFQALWKKLWVHFPDLCIQNEAVCCEVQKHSGSFRLSSFIKKLSAHFLNLCVKKWSCLPWSPDKFWKLSACESYRKSCGRNSTICAPKNEAACHDIQTHSGSSLLASFTEKVVGTIPRFMCPKTKLFAVKLQTYFGSSQPANFT